MGLERLAMAMQDVDSIFDVDTIKAIRDRVCQLAKTEYGKEEKGYVDSCYYRTYPLGDFYDFRRHYSVE